jgi:SynChlorMet cassette radical SAM/SPASM protein ScmF
MNDTQQKRAYPLNSIYFYLTQGCNLHCRHCWIAPKFQAKGRSYPVLPLDIFQSIITQGKALGLCHVKLTGGEPLLHPRIGDILEHVEHAELDLSMETNAVLCKSRIARRIAACKNPFVSVSLDGADAETHEWVRGVSGCFEPALDGVRRLVRAGVRTQIIMSVIRKNRDQIKPVVRLADSLGVESIKFNLVLPIGGGEKLHDDGETLSVEELIKLGSWVENNLAASTGIKLIYDHPPAFRSLGHLLGHTGDGCGTCDILGIIGVLASGSYSMCGIGETVPELVFGQADKDRLADIWQNTRILRELRNGLPGHLEGICKDCLMKNICLGKCLALNYFRNKQLWEPFWYCREANKAGLFPVTRMRPGTTLETLDNYGAG